MTKVDSTHVVPHLTASGTNSLRDIKPPVEIPNGWLIVWYSLGALAVAALAFLAWRYWRKRRAQLAIVPVIPPHVRAKQKLQEALALLGQPREFCILVSDTIRWYLEERFDFHAPERTTEEFLYELQSTELLARDRRPIQRSLPARLPSLHLNDLRPSISSSSAASAATRGLAQRQARQTTRLRLFLGATGAR